MPFSEPEILEQSAATLRELAAKGELSPTELVEASLARIQDLDSRIGAFLPGESLPKWARKRATELEKKRARGAEPGPLFGVPVGLKDNLSLAGQPMSCGSRILQGYSASFTATAVQRLLDADAIPIGRCNMDEFGFGSSTEHSAWQATRNPWNLARIPGGSSGGSAAAVAARMVPLALGSDTGGSIRQPAALCGVTGLKPTYGRVSRFGLVAFGSSLDQIGPLARDAADAALALRVLPDPRDATTLSEPCEVPDLSEPELKGVRVGVPADYLEACDAMILPRVKEALAVLEELGAEPVELRLPGTRHAIATYYLLATSECSSNLARFDGVRYGFRSASGYLEEQYRSTRGRGFGVEAKRRILLGTFCLSAGYYDAYYKKALEMRGLLRRDFARAFHEIDVIVGPTTPIPPYELGAAVDDPCAMYRCDLLTVPANLAGVPALSVPCGFDASGMPVGLQILGPALGEDRILRVGAAYQRATSFHRARPPELEP
ncbi:MAG: Asp-tRNA(Asn)/Glu-tRNA(Gln) amidotransferase subunit GatA [Planctomycetota bacterium]